MYLAFKNNFLRYQILCVFTVSLIFIFRTAIPFFTPLFIFLYLFIGILVLLFNKEKIVEITKNFIRSYYLVFILSILLMGSFVFTDKLFFTILVDVINTIILLSFFFLFTSSISNSSDLKSINVIIAKLTILIAVVIAINLILKVFNIISIESVIGQVENSPTYTSNDYNFSILPVVLGIVSVFFIMFKSQRVNEKIVLNIILMIFSFAIIISGSRRGILIFGLFLSTIAITLILNIFLNKDHIIFRIAKSGRLFILVFFAVLVSILLVFKNTSYNTKNKLLISLGCKDILSTKVAISLKLYRYHSIFNSNILPSEVYDRIWTPVFNPLDPESSWGTRIHKTIFPLKGGGNDIVPIGAAGYLMDSTCNANSWNGNSYSFSEIGKTLSEKDTVTASVFCFVSDDFNGSWARIIGAIENEAISWGNEYDFDKKGEWQRLTCQVCCFKGEIRFLMYFCKNGVLDFSTLRGNIIFAYPQIETRSSILKNSDRHLNNEITVLNSSSNEKNVLKSITKPDILSIYPSNIFNSIFYNSYIYKINPQNKFKKVFSKYLKEDTTYYPFKRLSEADIVKNDFIDLRFVYLKFGMQIFKEEYSLTEKLFGGGFNFLNWYGYYFLKDKTASDWPHNPFLSILLYSGIFGLLIYCFFLYNVFYYYIKYIKEYPILFIFFLITFFFSFFSGGSPFDPPIMGFFSILPFFIHSIHKKHEKEQILPKSVKDESS